MSSTVNYYHYSVYKLLLVNLGCRRERGLGAKKKQLRQSRQACPHIDVDNVARRRKIFSTPARPSNTHA